ncbi:hypothetical protein HDU96_007700 [Phlyctochytrium bullatum]|nr:hypothetical protein HDU96_007700 [Phlyctochytrium bullatum]
MFRLKGGKNEPTVEVIVPPPSNRNQDPNGFVVMGSDDYGFAGAVRVNNPDRNRYVVSSHLALILFVGQGPINDRVLFSSKFNPELERAAASVHRKPIYSRTTMLWSLGNPGEVPHGTHDYPFVIECDPNVPPSITDQTVSNSARDVTYVLYCVLKRLNEDTIVIRKDLTVRRGVPWSEPRMISLTGPMLDELVQYELRVPQVVYIGDPTAAISVVLKTGGNPLQLKSIQCTFVEVITYDDDGKGPAVRENVLGKVLRTAESLPSNAGEVTQRFEVPNTDAAPDCDFRASNPSTLPLLKAFGGAAMVHHEIRIRVEYKRDRQVVLLVDGILYKLPFVCVVHPGSGGVRQRVDGPVSAGVAGSGASFSISRGNTAKVRGDGVARTSSKGSVASSASLPRLNNPGMGSYQAPLQQHPSFEASRPMSAPVNESASLPSLHYNHGNPALGGLPAVNGIEEPLSQLSLSSQPLQNGTNAMYMPQDSAPAYGQGLMAAAGVTPSADPAPLTQPSYDSTPQPPAAAAQEAPANATEASNETEDDLPTLDHLVGMHRAATSEHEPENDDEIRVSVGDMLLVRQAWVDGYAFGMNLTTFEEGIFPQQCLFGDASASDNAAEATAEAAVPPPVSSTLPVHTAESPSINQPVIKTGSVRYSGTRRISSRVTSPAEPSAAIPALNTLPVVTTQTETLPKVALALNQKYALHYHLPRSASELRVSVGDIVTLDEVYENEWGFGDNDTTQERGWYPLVILGPDFGGPPAEGGPVLLPQIPAPPMPSSTPVRPLTPLVPSDAPNPFPAEEDDYLAIPVPRPAVKPVPPPRVGGGGMAKPADLPPPPPALPASPTTPQAIPPQDINVPIPVSPLNQILSVPASQPAAAVNILPVSELPVYDSGPKVIMNRTAKDLGDLLLVGAITLEEYVRQRELLDDLEALYSLLLEGSLDSTSYLKWKDEAYSRAVLPFLT